MGMLLRADGSKDKVKPASGKTFTLKELQMYVGGYIEHVRLPDGRPMFVDEEGKLKNKPPNAQATRLSGLYPRDIIAGDAIVCEFSEVETDDTVIDQFEER